MNDLLHNMYLFKNLDNEEKELIDGIAEHVHYPSEKTIFNQHDMADSFYVIQYGLVAINQRDEEGNLFQVATFGTGSHFGELALLDNEPRSSNAITVSHTDLIKIDYAAMNDLLETNSTVAHHFYREISKFLCSRLRLTTLDLGYSISQNLQYL